MTNNEMNETTNNVWEFIRMHLGHSDDLTPIEFVYDMLKPKYQYTLEQVDNACRELIRLRYLEFSNERTYREDNGKTYKGDMIKLR